MFQLLIRKMDYYLRRKAIILKYLDDLEREARNYDSPGTNYAVPKVSNVSSLIYAIHIAMLHYNYKQKKDGHTVVLQRQPMVVAIVSNLMKRALTLEVAQHIAFFDSTGSYDYITTSRTVLRRVTKDCLQ